MARITPAASLSSRGVFALVSLLLLLALVAPTTLFIATHPLGNSFPDDASACQAEAEESGPYSDLVDQGTPTTAVRSWLPPTVICSVDVLRNGHPVVTRHRQWLAIFLVLLETVGAVAALLRLGVAAGARLRGGS